MREETRDAILAVAERPGFDATVANLRSQKTGFVAVTIPSLNHANFADTVRGLSPVLSEHGLQVLLGHTDSNVAQEERLIEQLLRRRPEAIVVTGGHHTPRGWRLLEKAGIPVIETWDLRADPIGHVVGFSNAAAMRSVVDHLVGLGHRRIAFIGGDADGDTRGADRGCGFVAATRAQDPGRLIAAGQPPIAMRGAPAGRAARHRGGGLCLGPFRLRGVDRMPAPGRPRPGPPPHRDRPGPRPHRRRA